MPRRLDPLLTLSATALAAKIRARDVTSLEVVDAHIDQIKRVNPLIHAVVAPRFDQAKAEARRADAQVKRGDPAALRPLHGVPCTIKECFSFEGMPNTSGLVSRKGIVATKDATAVARLRAAGAIPLGVTNVSELCMWMESANNVYGRTRNPYDLSRIVGGSSGGEGAIVGAAGSPFGLGSDIGGSIRMPAFFNGVFGHKPSGGLVPGTGQYPLASGAALRYLTTGPICRRGEDLWPLLKILAGPDGVDTGCEAMALGDPDRVAIDALDVMSVEGNGAIGCAVDEVLVQAQRGAVDALRVRGATVRTASFPQLRRSLEIWSTLLAQAGGPSFAELLGNGTPISGWDELRKWIGGGSEHTFPAIALALLERMPLLHDASRVPSIVALAADLKRALIDAIGPRGVMLYPSYPKVAPKHDTPIRRPFQWIYTAVLNVMELPVTQVPLGLSMEGLPLGVQVAAAPGNDHLCVAVARALEASFGGWQAPRLATEATSIFA